MYVPRDVRRGLRWRWLGGGARRRWRFGRMAELWKDQAAVDAPLREGEPGAEVFRDGAATASRAGLGGVPDTTTPEATDGLSALGDLMVESKAAKTTASEAPHIGLAARSVVHREGALSAASRPPGVDLVQSWILAPPVFPP